MSKTVTQFALVFCALAGLLRVAGMLPFPEFVRDLAPGAPRAIAASVAPVTALEDLERVIRHLRSSVSYDAFRRTGFTPEALRANADALGPEGREGLCASLMSGVTPELLSALAPAWTGMPCAAALRTRWEKSWAGSSPASVSSPTRTIPRSTHALAAGDPVTAAALGRGEVAIALLIPRWDATTTPEALEALLAAGVVPLLLIPGEEAKENEAALRRWAARGLRFGSLGLGAWQRDSFLPQAKASLREEIVGGHDRVRRAAGYDAAIPCFGALERAAESDPSVWAASGSEPALSLLPRATETLDWRAREPGDVIAAALEAVAAADLRGRGALLQLRADLPATRRALPALLRALARRPGARWADFEIGTRPSAIATLAP